MSSGALQLERIVVLCNASFSRTWFQRCLFQAMGVLTEKLGAILEDVCEVHKYNKENPIQLPN